MGKVEGYAVPVAFCHHVRSEEVVMDGDGGGEKGYAVPDAFCYHVCSEEVVMDGEGGGEVRPVLSPPFGYIPFHINGYEFKT